MKTVEQTLLIGGIEVKRQDEEYAMTWYEASETLTDGWRLPTKEEVKLLYRLYRHIVGFDSNWYWSSSECLPIYSWKQDFGRSSDYLIGKNCAAAVRAVRFIKNKESRPRDYSKREKDRLDLIDEMAEKAMNDATIKTLTEVYHNERYCYFRNMSHDELISTAKQMDMFIEETLL
jgi:hypothetical protein